MEPVAMDVVEGELERAQRGEEVSDAAIERIVGGEMSGGGERSGMSTFKKKEEKRAEKK